MRGGVNQQGSIIERDGEGVWRGWLRLVVMGLWTRGCVDDVAGIGHAAKGVEGLQGEGRHAKHWAGRQVLCNTPPSFRARKRKLGEGNGGEKDQLPPTRHGCSTGTGQTVPGASSHSHPELDTELGRPLHLGDVGLR